MKFIATVNNRFHGANFCKWLIDYALVLFILHSWNPPFFKGGIDFPENGLKGGSKILVFRF